MTRLMRVVIYLMTILDGQRLIQLALAKYIMPLCCIGLGLITTLGYAPYDNWVIGLLALSLFCIYLLALHSAKRILVASLCYFSALNCITLWWLDFVLEGFGQIPLFFSALIIVIFAVYLALPYALLYALAFRLARDHKAIMLLCFIPAFSVLADFFIGSFLTGFGWMYLGYMCQHGPLASFAPLIGVRGISFLLILCAGALSLGAIRQFIFLPLVGVIFLAGVFLTGISFTNALPARQALLVQGNIEQSLHWNKQYFATAVDTYWQLSKPYLGKTDVIIWPESAIPAYYDQVVQLIEDLDTVARDNHTVLLTGLLHRDEQHSYNSLYALGTEHIEFYDKQRLVPFGEFVPFEDYLRPLGQIFNIPMSDFSYGQEQPAVFNLAGVNFIPAICYEALYPEQLHSFSDPQAIVMVSNDAWFGPTRGPLQHLAIARMRGLELQKPILRATTSGQSVAYAANGDILGHIAPASAGAVAIEFIPTQGQTPYYKAGNWPLCCITLLLIALGLWLRKRSTTATLLDLIRP